MLHIDKFYKPVNKQSYLFGDFINQFPDFMHFALNEFENKIGCIKYSNNFAIKVASEKETATIYSLLTDVHLQDCYNGLILENGLNFMADIIKETEEIIDIVCDVKIPTYDKIQVIFKVKKCIYRTSNKKMIKFPEDCFLKGLPILGEIISQAQLNSNVISIKDKNQQYINYREYCLYKIKQAA